MIDEFPFPIQRIQSDRGAEFSGTDFQKAMRNNSILDRYLFRSAHFKD